MTQTLMAAFDEDEPVFPDTEEVLFLGGPAHGEVREVVWGDRSMKIMAKPPLQTRIDNGVPLLNGAAVPEAHTYYRRPIGMEDEHGQRYQRDVFIHESVPNPQAAQQVLMAALLSSFVKGGRKVVDSEQGNRP